jgi:putative endonuclease
MASDRNGTIDIGVTNNLAKRAWEHKNKIVPGFTNKYNANKLVYYEIFEDIQFAIKREKRLKEWPREWKLDLIEKDNPQWHDLYNKIYC